MVSATATIVEGVDLLLVVHRNRMKRGVCLCSGGGRDVDVLDRGQ